MSKDSLEGPELGGEPCGVSLSKGSVGELELGGELCGESLLKGSVGELELGGELCGVLLVVCAYTGMPASQPDAPAVGILVSDLASNSDTLFLTNEVAVLCGIRIPLGRIAKIGVLALCSAGGSSSRIPEKPSKLASLRSSRSRVSSRTFLKLFTRDSIASLSSSAR